jgi:hypothetical protein
MNAPEVIARVQVPGCADQVRVALETVKGATVVDLRLCTPFTMAGVAMPTKTGVAFPVGTLPGLAAAIQLAERTARDLGLLSAEEA